MVAESRHIACLVVYLGKFFAVVENLRGDGVVGIFRGHRLLDGVAPITELHLRIVVGVVVIATAGGRPLRAVVLIYGAADNGHLTFRRRCAQLRGIRIDIRIGHLFAIAVLVVGRTGAFVPGIGTCIFLLVVFVTTGEADVCRGITIFIGLIGQFRFAPRWLFYALVVGCRLALCGDLIDGSPLNTGITVEFVGAIHANHHNLVIVTLMGAKVIHRPVLIGLVFALPVAHNCTVVVSSHDKHLVSLYIKVSGTVPYIAVVPTRIAGNFRFYPGENHFLFQSSGCAVGHLHPRTFLTIVPSPGEPLRPIIIEVIIDDGIVHLVPHGILAVVVVAGGNLHIVIHIIRGAMLVTVHIVGSPSIGVLESHVSGVAHLGPFITFLAHVLRATHDALVATVARGGRAAVVERILRAATLGSRHEFRFAHVYRLVTVALERLQIFLIEFSHKFNLIDLEFVFLCL